MANSVATNDVPTKTSRVHTTPRVDPLGGGIIEQQQRPSKDWVNILFLTLTPVIGIAGTAVYTWQTGLKLWMPLLLVGMYLAVGLSITAGYHRFFSHKTYEAAAPVQLFYAIFGALAAQNSILWWSSSHRVHHKYADKDWDPYNIRRGFWWAHILWIFYKNEERDDTFENSPDLKANKIVMWQHRWHKAILIVVGFGMPMAIGAAFGDVWAGLLWGGFARIALIHHTTFFVNSLAHTLGKPIYNAEASARDNWLVALATLGEGYHSFHHRFPADFRNGIRWYDWDPAKWWIAALRYAGLAKGLLVTPLPQIEQARMRAAVRVVESKMHEPSSIADEARRRLKVATTHLEKSMALWRRAIEQKAEGLGWRKTRRIARAHVKRSRRHWKTAVRMLQTA
jgi:stearoyl-CoA desaturase (Delta-9 desaturase)